MEILRSVTNHKYNLTNVIKYFNTQIWMWFICRLYHYVLPYQRFYLLISGAVKKLHVPDVYPFFLFTPLSPQPWTVSSQPILQVPTP